ncbi:MAG TPA: hypothetical protein VNM90_15725 [Haliangium sp.]|nr:hypothetical protein [Haliangium sp.]
MSASNYPYALPPQPIANQFYLPTKTIPVAEPLPESPYLQENTAIKHLKQTGAYDSLVAAVEAARYHFEAETSDTRNSHVQQVWARNPKQSYEAELTADGVVLKSALNYGQPWTVTMKLLGIGYGDQLHGVEPGILSVAANQATLLRVFSDSNDSPSFFEWYVNRAQGLEQGFALSARPGTKSNAEWVRLAFQVGGMGSPTVTLGARWRSRATRR